MLNEMLEYNEYLFPYCRALKIKNTIDTNSSKGSTDVKSSNSSTGSADATGSTDATDAKSKEAPDMTADESTASKSKGKKVTRTHDYRITGGNIKNSQTGFARALEIRARYEIFHKGSPKITAKKLKSVRSELLSWLGEFKNPDNLKFMGLSDKDLEQVLTKDIPGFIGRYSKDSIKNKHGLAESRSAKGDFNTPSFDRTIASALEAGPLQEYILIENEDLFSRIYKRDIRKGSVNQKGVSFTDKKGIAPHKDFLRKFTAAYLIAQYNAQQKNYASPQEAIHLNESVIFNWASEMHKPSYYIDDEEPVFEKIALFKGLNKYKPHPIWKDNYSIMNITDKERFKEWLKDPENKGVVYYTDEGFSKKLKRHVV